MKKIEVKTWLYYFLAFLHTSCSYAQKEESSQKPRIHIDVKKETDKYGNIIRYDSTYSWSWSNIDSEDSFKMIDSMYSKLLNEIIKIEIIFLMLIAYFLNLSLFRYLTMIGLISINKWKKCCNNIENL